jgi:hypothetical protein
MADDLFSEHKKTAKYHQNTLPFLLATVSLVKRLGDHNR